MEVLRIENLGKKFPDAAQWAVKDFNLTVQKGEIAALLGESGCGKTTILRMIAGFETPTHGNIFINQNHVAGTTVFKEPQQRNVGIVFQDYALFPHKTVWENIIFGLFKSDRSTSERKTRDIIDICGLSGLEKRFPHQLSGGQKQRVALARALAPEPGVILFDEPFSNLDSMRRNQMRDEIRTIVRNTRATAIFVTHDTRDVLAIADKVAVLKEGFHLQTNQPVDVYYYPVNAYVADFFGKTNIIRGKLLGNIIDTPIGQFATTAIENIKDTSWVEISLRPEQITLTDDIAASCKAKVISERFLGEYKEVICLAGTEEKESLQLIIYAPANREFTEGVCFIKPNTGHVGILQNEIVTKKSC